MPIHLGLLCGCVVWRLTGHLISDLCNESVNPLAYFLLCQACAFGFTVAGSLLVSQWCASKLGRWSVLALSLLGLVEALSEHASAIGFEAGQLGRVVIALWLGASIGQRIAYPRYFWPLILVATATDIVSVLATDGFSHSVAKSVASQGA